jgi:signal transduction histidine kinase
MATLIIMMVLALSGLALFWSALFTWWDDDFPGAKFFGLFSFLTGCGVLLVAFGGVSTVPQAVVVALLISIGIGLPVPWLLFAFAYTGQPEFLDRKVILLISTVPVLGILSTLIIFGSQFIVGLQLPSLDTAEGLTAVIVAMLTSVQWFALLLAGGLIIIGSGLLIWLFQRYKHLNLSIGALLGVAAIAPWMGVLFAIQLINFHREAAFFVLTAGVGIGTISTLLLVGPTKHDLFESSPAPGRIAANVVVRDLDDIVIVTDRDGRVIQLNEIAERSLAQQDTNLIGIECHHLLGQSLSSIDTGDLLTLHSEQGKRIFEASKSALTDPHDQTLGFAVLLRDQTTQITRQQRLEVLNRVLRHNLRNEMNVILGKAIQLKGELHDPDCLRLVDDIAGFTQQTVDLGDQIQRIETMLDMPRDQMQDDDIETVLSDVTTQACEDHGEATIEMECQRTVVLSNCNPLLQLLLDQLIKNAILHNNTDHPQITISTDYDTSHDFPLSIEVSDNGPGIPDHEKRVLEAGTETPLEHSSGLGLWTVQWGMTRFHGKIYFEETPDTGATVGLRFPQSMIHTENN